MAEIVVGSRQTTEIARCSCGAVFVMRTEDDLLFDHEAQHQLEGMTFSTDVQHVRLPFLSCQIEEWAFWNRVLNL